MQPAGPAEGWLHRAARYVHAAEDALLIGLLGSMILIGASQIFMRNVLGEGLGWADESQRLLVLWIGMLGAMAASRNGRQLRIDLVSRYLQGLPRRLIESLADLLTAAVSSRKLFIPQSKPHRHIMLRARVPNPLSHHAGAIRIPMLPTLPAAQLISMRK